MTIKSEIKVRYALEEDKQRKIKERHEKGTLLQQKWGGMALV